MSKLIYIIFENFINNLNKEIRLTILQRTNISDFQDRSLLENENERDQRIGEASTYDISMLRIAV